MSATSSPLTALQRQFAHPKSRSRFDTALSSWSAQDPALEGVGSHERLSEVLASRDYARHDEVLYALLQRAALAGAEGVVAGEVVLNAMSPAVPRVVGRVIRASRAVIGTFGAVAVSPEAESRRTRPTLMSSPRSSVTCGSRFAVTHFGDGTTSRPTWSSTLKGPRFAHSVSTSLKSPPRS